MSTLQEQQDHSFEERLRELQREEAELEQRTAGYQWNHAIALVLSTLAVVLAFVALAVALTRKPGIAHMSMPVAATAPSSAIVAGGPSAGSALPVMRIAMAVKPDARLGSDGGKHDAFVPRADLTVKAGQTVRMSISNYDDMPHSFTSPGLAAGAAIPTSEQQRQGSGRDLTVMPGLGIGLDVNLPGATGKGPSKTTFTFRAPTKPGTYVYYCKLPCDPWAMSHFGYMMGHIRVTRA
jgi:plastocyanin